MYIFRSIQKFFAIAGINSYQSLQVHPFNARNLTIFSLFGLFSISNVIYFLYIAANFIEYGDIIFRLSTLTVVAIVYGIFVKKMRKIFEIFDKFERIIDKSECKITNLSYRHCDQFFFFFRTHISKIGKNLRKYKSKCRKMVSIGVFCYSECFISCCSIADV